MTIVEFSNIQDGQKIESPSGGLWKFNCYLGIGRKMILITRVFPSMSEPLSQTVSVYERKGWTRLSVWK